jgi:hypothetical protein
MENSQFLTIIGLFITLIGMGGAGFGWLIIKLFKMQKEISVMTSEILEMKIELLGEIRGLDSRIAHIEGYLIGSAQKTGTEKK